MKKFGSPIGKGLKLAVYVPPDAMWIVGKIRRLSAAVKARGYRSSFNFEIVRLLKFAIKCDRCGRKRT